MTRNAASAVGLFLAMSAVASAGGGPRAASAFPSTGPLTVAKLCSPVKKCVYFAGAGLMLPPRLPPLVCYCGYKGAAIYITVIRDLNELRPTDSNEFVVSLNETSTASGYRAIYLLMGDRSTAELLSNNKFSYSISESMKNQPTMGISINSP